MKKLLLALAAVAMSFGAYAQTTITATQLAEAIGSAKNIDGYTIDIEKNNGTTVPSLHAGTNAIRLYAKGSIAISGENISKIVFTLAKDAGYRYTTFTPSTGDLNPAQAEGDVAITWEGSSSSVTFTVGEKATMGSDGAEKAGQIRFTEVTIYGEGGEGPVVPTPTPSDNVFEESFAAGQGQFTIENVTLPEALTYVWTADTKYGYMKASAFKEGVSYASESWLISPVITLTQDNTLAFEHCYNKFPDLAFAKANCTLNIREEGGIWTAVEIPTCSDNASWTFVNSGDIALANYNGKRIQLGFMYRSEDGKSGTWEIKNLVIKSGKSGIADVEIDANAPVEYYNLQGVRVEEPAAGLYIRRQGNNKCRIRHSKTTLDN